MTGCVTHEADMLGFEAHNAICFELWILFIYLGSLKLQISLSKKLLTMD